MRFYGVEPEYAFMVASSREVVINRDRDAAKVA
jgi:hypothetical protein